MSDRSQNGQFVVLACCAVVVVLHQATHWPWFIEDAAICFAYARNIATGEGAVPFPGGERIEAYSDPLWVALLALFHFLGVDGWTASKPLGMAFGVAALWPVWRLARIALPDHRGAGALLAPILLSLNAQFAIWSASGLENGLFGFLLAMALWRSSLEARDGGPPWSAGWFLLLAWTRPEGLLYAAAGGLWFWIAAHRAGRGLRPVLLWVAAFWGPSLALEALRIAYFLSLIHI